MQRELAEHFRQSVGGFKLEARDNEVPIKVLGDGRPIGLPRALTERAHYAADGMDGNSQAQVVGAYVVLDHHLAWHQIDWAEKYEFSKCNTSNVTKM